MPSEVTEGNGPTESKVRVEKDIEKAKQPLQEIDKAKKALHAVNTFPEPNKDEKRSKNSKNSKSTDFIKDLFWDFWNLFL